MSRMLLNSQRGGEKALLQGFHQSRPAVARGVRAQARQGGDLCAERKGVVGTVAAASVAACCSSSPYFCRLPSRRDPHSRGLLVALCSNEAVGTAETETAEATSEGEEGASAQQQGGAASEDAAASEGEASAEEAPAEEEPSYKALVGKLKAALEGDDPAAAAAGLLPDLESEFESALAAAKESQSQAAATQEESSKLKEQYLRLNADFDNFRKRTASEKDSLSKNARGSTLEELLPVIDNFEMARTQLVLETEAEQKVSDSYQNLYKSLVETLKKLGLETIESVGTKFDPELHDAIMQEETTEHEDSTVLEEYRRGFMFQDRLLRAAMVKVAINNSAPAGAAGSTSQAPEGSSLDEVEGEAPSGDGNAEEEGSSSPE